MYQPNFVVTPRKFIVAKHSIRKLGSSSVLNITPTDEDLSLRIKSSGVASSISEGDIFIYLCSAQLTSVEIDLISKEINCAEQEYMNMSPSLIELATPLIKSFAIINLRGVTTKLN